jgi:hypothetical protein
MGLFDGREPNIKGAIRCPRCGLNLHPSIEECPACGQNPHAPVPPQQPYQAQAAQHLTNVPAAPQESAPVMVGVIQHDIVIGGAVAFRAGERVQIEEESPDPERPDYKYVVTSQAMQKKYRLSDMDLFV